MARKARRGEYELSRVCVRCWLRRAAVLRERDPRTGIEVERPVEAVQLFGIIERMAAA